MKWGNLSVNDPEYHMRVDQHPNYEDTIYINVDDKDLIPIKISVKDVYERTFREHGFKPPPMPKIGTIDFVNLPREDQYFKRIWAVPQKLIGLEAKIRKKWKALKQHKSLSYKEVQIINEFWDTIAENRVEYKKEIEYIHRIWYYRLFGYWFMNNGIPTYITGLNFTYLYFYYIPSSKTTSGLPDYRDRDRRWFIAQQMIRTETRTFATLDKDGWAVPEEDGSYKMVDLGTRVFYGSIISKPRRVGDTSKSGCDQIEEATRCIEQQFGNQAMDDTSAERVFSRYIVTPFNKFPLFLKPLQTQLNPKANLIFDNDDPELGLGSWIDYATTKDRSAYDGSALRKYYGDEVGKVKHISVKARHGTVRLCLSERDVIIGNSTYTTTVEEMGGSAAEEFMSLSVDSHYHQRIDNGQTKSGMVVLFFPAYDGHPKFIDKYGMSVIGTPTPEQARFIKREIGAREYILNNRRLLKGEELALAKRQDPITYRECFSPDPKNALFRNLDQMQERIIDLKLDRSLYRVGNLKWINDEKFTKVEWVDDPENGKFIVSKHFHNFELNQVRKEEGVHYPANVGAYIACADPFRLEKTDSERMSKGGLIGYWNRDFGVDPEGTPRDQMKSDRYFMDYLEKPDSMNEYVEDCLMACIYWGMMMYSENNIPVINEKFIEWGFGGYLLYDVDPVTMTMKNNAGFSIAGSSGRKADMFNSFRDHMRFNALRCMHYRILQQAIDLKGLDDMKNQDLLAAAIGVWGAKKSIHMQLINEDLSDNVDTTNWLPRH